MAMASGSTSVLGLRSSPLRFSTRRSRSCRAAPVSAHATRPSVSGSKAGKAALAAFSSLAVPAAFAADVVESVSRQAQQGLSASEVPQWSSVPVPSFEDVPDDFVSVLSANPVLLLGGVAAIAIPLLLAQGLIGDGGAKAKATSAANALEALSEDASTLFVDIRSAADAKEEGSPNLGRTKGKSLTVPYTKVAKDGSVEEVEGWAERLAKSVKEDSVVILFDSDGKVAPQAGAALLAVAELETLYYVQDGAEGPRGWKASELPWKAKGRGFALPQFSGNFDTLAEDFKAAPTVGKAALAVGAIGAASLLLFNELGGALEFVGIIGAVNLVGRNLLFAKDRKKTAEELQTLVDEKIAVKDAGDDFKKLARSVLETPVPAAEKATEKAGSVANRAADKVDEVIDKVNPKLQKAGAQLPSTREAGKDLKALAADAGDLVKEGADKVVGAAKGGKTADDAADAVRSGAQKVESKAKDVAEKVEAKVEDAADRTKAATDKAADRTKAAADDAADRTQAAADDASSKTANGAEGAQSDAKKWIEDWRSKR